MRLVAKCGRDDVHDAYNSQVWQTKAKNQTVKVESVVTLQAEKRGGTAINFLNGATVNTEYSGADNLLSELQSNQTKPLSLAAGDFDGDGVDDLISGYATENGGLLTVHRGNVDSIFPGATKTQPPPFLPEAKIFAAPEQLDFLVIGDFNNDGKQDIVTAARNTDALNFFKGDGNLPSAERISVSGKVTALTAGELNRKDSLIDLAVGIVGADGAKVF